MSGAIRVRMQGRAEPVADDGVAQALQRRAPETE